MQLDTVQSPAANANAAANDAGVPDPDIRVRQPDHNGEWSVWKISQNLTTRDGDINDVDCDNKPLGPLLEDDALMTRLLGQMWSDETFVARKDGQYGILFEIEFTSQESELSPGRGHEHSQWVNTLKPHAEIVTVLLAGLAQLAPQFPGVLFAVPGEQQIYNERPAVWAFVADGLLNDTQRDELGKALSGL